MNPFLLRFLDQRDIINTGKKTPNAPFMKSFSKNQLQRYPIYLKFFKELAEAGVENISSPRIAGELGYSEEQIRKDLQAVCDEPGRPKKGRNVRDLIETLENFLGYKEATSAVIIGCGRLGGALLNYPNFNEMGLSILAGFDIDPVKTGTTMGGKMIYPLEKLDEVLAGLKARIAIICVPASSAQEVVDRAVKSGALGIWNFAPTHISAPENIVIENVNLASSLAVLSNRINQITSLKPQ
jgi:redox-sensing transcriptional repressor